MADTVARGYNTIEMHSITHDSRATRSFTMPA
jgi:hypothetical protein